jgi:hypothetical protein
MTHTSAPWTLKKLAGTKGPQAIIKKLPGGIDAIVCLFVRSVGMSKEEARANAVLITKAPDLFRVMDDVNNALYRVEGDPEGLWRVNQSSLDSGQ